MGCIFVKCGHLARASVLILLGVFAVLFPTHAQSVSLVFTSSLGGAVSNLETKSSRPAGLLHLQNSIQQLKKEERALWLDAGDLLDGSPESMVLGDGSPFLGLVQGLGPDLVVPGETDFRRLNLSLPWTAANLTLFGERIFPGHRVFVRGGKKIVVLGLSRTLRGHELHLPQGLEIQDPLQSALEWVPKLRALEQPDLLVVVLHGRRFGPSDGEDTKLRGFIPSKGASALARQVPGIDLLLFGHHDQSSHDFGVEPFSQGTVMARGASLGRELLVLRWEEEHWKSQVILPEPVGLPAIRSLLGDSFVDQMLGPLGLELKRTSKASLGKCLNDLLDVSFGQQKAVGTAFSKVFLRGRQTGPLTGASLFTWFPFDDHQQWLWVSQRDLALLARPAAPFGKRKAPYRRQLALKLRQPMDLDLQALGLSPNVRDRKYKLLVGDYHFYGGGAIIPMLFTTLPEQPKGPSLRGAVSRYLQSQGPLPSSCPMLSYGAK